MTNRIFENRDPSLVYMYTVYVYNTVQTSETTVDILKSHLILKQKKLRMWKIWGGVMLTVTTHRQRGNLHQ